MSCTIDKHPPYEGCSPKFKSRGKSLNPSDAQIRAWEIEETLRRTRKTTGELFPNAGELYATLNKPVNKIKYYQIARCRVKYQVG